MRVTSPAVEYLSMLEKENVWILRNMDWRRLCANPLEARAPYLPESTPQARDSIDITAIAPPVMQIVRTSPFSTPLSMR